MTIQELIDKRAKLIADMRALHDLADKEDRALSDEENETWKTMHSDSDELRKRVEQKQELEKAEKALDDFRDTPIKPEIKDDPSKKDDDLDQTRNEPVHYSDTKEYRQAFQNYLARGDRYLTQDELRVLQAGSDPLGGYTIPREQFVKQLIQEIDSAVWVRGATKKFQLKQAKQIKFPTLDLATNPTDPLWISELQSGDYTDLDFNEITFNPQALGKKLKISNTLLMESVLPMEAIIRERIGYKFGATLENAYLNGDGTADRPAGVFHVNGIPVTRDVVSGGAAVAYDDLVNLVYKVRDGYRNGCSFVMHSDVAREIMKLKDNDGRPLWTPSMREGEPDRILGRAVRHSEFAPAVIASGNYSMLFGNFDYYYVVEELSLRIARANELFMEEDSVAFFFRMMTTGKPILDSAFARLQMA